MIAKEWRRENKLAPFNWRFTLAGFAASMRRKRYTRAQKAFVVARQHGRCDETGVEFMDGDVIEYDHRIPLALGGEDSLENLRAVLATAHAFKTKRDVKDIARAKRRELYQQTGRSSRSTPKPIFNRGFDKGLRKKMNGKVEVRHGRGLPPVRRDSGRTDLTPGAR